MRYKFNKFKRDMVTGNRYYLPTLVSAIPISDTDKFIRVVVGERFDTLAQKFYGDSNLWWIIAKANDMADGKIMVDSEKKIRIPMNIQPILAQLEKSNA